jgi:signal transduction histidine kinase
LSRRLHPPEWQRLTMEEAVRQLWDLSGIPQSLEASLRIEALRQQPDLSIKVLMYRAVQEALSNLTRHSRATKVEAILESRDERLRVTIRDNGIGFDVAAFQMAPASVASGIGLRSIQEQAASLGAKVDVESGPNGTTLMISAPFFSEGS